MFRYLFLFSLLLLSNLCAACVEPSDRIPLDRISREVRTLFLNRNFTKLEALAKDYKKGQLASDGQYKLIGFYSGVSAPALKSCDEGFEAHIGESKEWNQHRQFLLEWHKKFPQSTTAQIALAEFERNYAWYARGTGLANTVGEENWKLFIQRVANARAILEKIGPIAKNDPRWYTNMLRVGIEQGWEYDKFEQLFREGVRKFPYYYPFYITKSKYVSEKWYGSKEAFKTFIDEAVNATRKQLGETLYTRLHMVHWSPEMFLKGQTDWGRMKQGFEKIIKDFPDSANQNSFAKFACIADDIDTLERQFQKIGNDIIIAAWDDSMKNVLDCKKLPEYVRKMSKRAQ